MLACAARRGREILPRVPHLEAGIVAVPFCLSFLVLFGFHVDYLICGVLSSRNCTARDGGGKAFLGFRICKRHGAFVVPFPFVPGFLRVLR